MSHPASEGAVAEGLPASIDLVLTTGTQSLPEGDAWATGTLTLPPHDPAARWATVATELEANAAAWDAVGHVLVLADGVEMTAPAAAELFRVMRQAGLDVAQPSLAWSSHFTEPTALHNPSFVLRFVNRVDTAALAFSKAALRRWLPLMRELPGDAALARLLTLCHDTPLRAAAVVDAVQAVRTLAPADHESAPPQWPAALQSAGPHHDAPTTWGGLSLRGRDVGLFDDSREEFLGLLTAGYACAVQEAEPIGEVFLAHFARSLEPPPPAIHLQFGAGPLPPMRRSPIVDHTRDAVRRTEVSE